MMLKNKDQMYLLFIAIFLFFTYFLITQNKYHLAYFSEDSIILKQNEIYQSKVNKKKYEYNLRNQ